MSDRMFESQRKEINWHSFSGGLIWLEQDLLSVL